MTLGSTESTKIPSLHLTSKKLWLQSIVLRLVLLPIDGAIVFLHSGSDVSGRHRFKLVHSYFVWETCQHANLSVPVHEITLPFSPYVPVLPLTVSLMGGRSFKE